MEKQILDFLELLKGALQDETVCISDDFDMEWAETLAKRHRIVPLFYYGAVKAGISPESEQMQRLFVSTVKHATIGAVQMKLVHEVFAAFDEAGIDYMPLKGTLLKQMYPAPEMRTMGDADILIHTNQYDRIRPIMLRLGYTEKLESDHELTWSKPNSYIELHKRLIPSYNKDYYAYYGDGWRLATEKNGTRYAMTDEDQMIYLFTHYAKHYRDSGIGVGHVLDLWVYRKNKPLLNEAYIVQELEKLMLDQFYKNTLDTLAVWFEGKEPTAVTEMITSVIFNSGVFGKREIRILSAALKAAKKTGNAKSVRNRKVFYSIFPSYKEMQQKFTVLKKMPILLPVFWGVRIVKVLLFKRKEIAASREEYRTSSEENIDAYCEGLRFVGLDFNFKE